MVIRKANIKIVDGSVFLIDGDDSSLPTLELRLLSNNTNLPNSVVNLTADVEYSERRVIFCSGW